MSHDFPKLLNSMQVGVDRIEQIISSLRRFSRHDESELKMADIHDGMDSTLMILQSRLKPNHHFSRIQVIKQYGNLPLALCYPGQLNQVFMNILSNAIDVLEEQPEPRLITIMTEVVKEEIQPNGAIDSKTNLQLLIRIQDNGSGIPETIRAKIFDPFFTTE